MPGPLPEASRRRRNSPTVPQTKLAAGGRKGRPPNPPYSLGNAGRAWWRWAWALPQALAWDRGALYALGRRAQLEDSLAALDQFDPGSLDQFFAGLKIGGDPDRLRDACRDLGYIIGRLQSLAGGRLSVVREMRELDKRFGLDPKALAENRWEIVKDEEDEPAARPAAKGSSRRARLTVVA